MNLKLEIKFNRNSSNFNKLQCKKKINFVLVRCAASLAFIQQSTTFAF